MYLIVHLILRYQQSVFLQNVRLMTFWVILSKNNFLKSFSRTLEFHPRQRWKLKVSRTVDHVLNLSRICLLHVRCRSKCNLSHIDETQPKNLFDSRLMSDQQNYTRHTDHVSKADLTTLFFKHPLFMGWLSSRAFYSILLVFTTNS